MRQMQLIIDLKNYNTSGTIFKRVAARAIVRRGNDYLLIHGKYGDYKFPGGGVESGESLKSALIREVQEETGYIVKPETVVPYGTAQERRKGELDDIMEMKSHYFLCDIESETAERRLDEYEEEYDYQVIWLQLRKAVEFNRSCVDMDACPWVKRDTMVMEHLLAQDIGE